MFYRASSFNQRWDTWVVRVDVYQDFSGSDVVSTVGASGVAEGLVVAIASWTHNSGL
jgi:hypothetical protein